LFILFITIIILSFKSQGTARYLSLHLILSNISKLSLLNLIQGYRFGVIIVYFIVDGLKNVL